MRESKVTHMQKAVNGLIELNTGYGVLDFLHPEKTPIPIGTFEFDTYVEAVTSSQLRFYPSSYRQYLLAVQNLTPDNDIWNNLLFAGHAQGIFDAKTNTFRNVRQHDMHASSDIEIALVEALASTYQCLQTMVQTF